MFLCSSVSATNSIMEIESTARERKSPASISRIAP
jgi:hypothetical protein